MNNPIAEKVETILQITGALLEEMNDGSIHVLFPPDVAAHLNVAEEITLLFESSPVDSQSEEQTVRAGVSNLVMYNPEFLQPLSRLLVERGLCTERLIKGLYLKQTGLSAAVQSHFTVLNGIGRMIEYHEQMTSYLICNCKYSALSDERKEGISRCAVNEFSGSIADELTTMLAWSDSEYLPSTIAVERKPIDKIYRALTKSARRIIEHELLHFQRSLNRRLQRDIERVSQYYGTLIAEIERKINRRALTGKEKQTEMQRIEATRLELKKKLLDQKERYKIKINVEFLNAMRIYMNVIVVAYEVQRRQCKRELFLVWNPLKKDFEDISCEHCGQELSSFSLCDDRLHILCQNCFRCSRCGKAVCQVCHPRICPKCGK
ncbi:MAG: hypothetical protein V1799_21410 [bacterium]